MPSDSEVKPKVDRSKQRPLKTSVIETLPAHKQKQVVDALLSGKSLREVGLIAGVSHVAVSAYKKKVVNPAIKAASQIVANQQLGSNPAEVTAHQASLTQALVKADPIISRLEAITAERDEVKRKALESGQLGVWGSLDRNDLSTLELQCKLDGRLDSGNRTVTNNLYVMATDFTLSGQPKPEPIEAEFEDVTDTAVVRPDNADYQHPDPDNPGRLID